MLKNLGWALLLLPLIVVSTTDYYTFQPLVPKAKALAPGAEDEYVVWLHGANSAYQERMLTFAETQTESDALFAIDYVGRRQFERYFGEEAARRRRLYLPLRTGDPVDGGQVKLFLLHWPGPAGGLSEQVEYRSSAHLRELRGTPGWGLIYDNGESFILLTRCPFNLESDCTK